MKPFDRIFLYLSYAVIVAGFSTLVFTGKLGVFDIAVISVFLVASWLWREPLAGMPRATKIANLGILLVFFISFAGFLFLDWAFVITTIRFLIFVQCVRILFLTEKRHYLQAYVISFFSVLAATVLTFSIIFLVFFVVYLVLMTTMMILYTISSDIDRFGGAARARALNIRSAPIFYTALGAVGFILVSTVMIFIFFPRISAGFFPSSLVDPVRMTGFSRNVELGDVGNLKVDTSLVMRVIIKNRAGEAWGNGPQYFRGTSYDTFDGKYWEKKFTAKTYLKRMNDVFFTQNPHDGEKIIQEYFIENNRLGENDLRTLYQALGQAGGQGRAITSDEISLLTSLPDGKIHRLLPAALILA